MTSTLTVAQAAALLQSGNLIGFPTETVYGLAARIDQPESLKKIFTTKERPFFDPLIVHVHDVNQARSLTSAWPKAADVLAKKFWPGPLTLVLPKSSLVDSVITSGLETVGIRMPSHPLALELLRTVNVPLAAPSANKFGRTSPTSAEHVRNEFRNSVAVLDGGPCQIGIESTVLRVTEDKGTTVLSLLRPGGVARPQIEDALAKAGLSLRWEESLERSLAPGQMKHHYMPEIPLVWVNNLRLSLTEVTARLTAELQNLPSDVEGVKLRKPTEALAHPQRFELEDDPTLAARALYSRLRDLSHSGADHLVYYHSPDRQGPLWEGILDRLKKAAHLILE